MMTAYERIQSMADVCEDIRVDVRGGALWITLCRPKSYNALTLSMVRQLDEVIQLASLASRIRCLVLIGTGPAFSAGADLSHLLNENQADAAKALKFFVRTAGGLFNRIESLGIPTIAALNGFALAGGLELALSCDIVFAAQGAKIGDAHAKYGQIPGGGATVRLPRRVGASRAKYLMFSGAHLSADKALAWGLVDEVVQDEDLPKSVQGLCDSIGERSPLVLRRMKTLVDRQGAENDRDCLEAELLESEAHFESHDQREGMLAFSQKRKPQYLGR